MRAVARWLSAGFVVVGGLLACSSDVVEGPTAVPTGAVTTGAGAGGASSSSATGGAATSTSSAGGADGGGGPGGGGAVGWTLYTLTGATGDLANGQWSNQALVDAWDSSDAPTEGVTTTASFYYFDDLVVLTEAGQVHRRDGSAWVAPVPLTSLFPGFLPTATISSYTIPGDWPQLGTPQEDRSTEGIVFSVSSADASNFYLYDVTETFAAPTLVASGIPGDGDADCSAGCATCDGPERPAVRERWAFRRLDEDAIGGPEGYRAWAHYDDGYVYQFGATFCWERTPAASHPMFAGKPGAPEPSAVVAAYLDASGVHMVVPP